MKDPYSILGVSKSATQGEIKKAHRKLVKETHPDLNPGKEDLAKRFKEVSEAYELIGTEEARKQYEASQIAAGQEQRFGRGRTEEPFYREFQSGQGGRYASSHGEDFEDILSQFFGRGGVGPRPQVKGQDLLFRLEIAFEESIRGGTRRITLPHGKTLDVKIPAGIESGKKLRFAGMGGEGSSGGPAGDAYVEIEVGDSSAFLRKGKDIEMKVPISVDEAVLGGKIEIETVFGPLQLSIPPATSSGKRLRLKGKGVPAKDGAGDLYVTPEISLPKKPDDELCEFLKRWRQTHAYNPRSNRE